MTAKSLRQVCESAGLKVGTFVCEFNTPGIGYILKNAGCDYAFIDMEHSGFDVSTMKSMLRYFEAAALPCFVRPAGKDYYSIARMLDIGAEGLILPMVASADEARGIIDMARYVPLGNRGVALGIAHDKYRSGPVQEKLADANEKTMIVPLIETAEGVSNVDDILALDGVDGVWLGHFDLSCSLGIAGQFDHPDFIASVKKVVDSAKRHNKPAGRVVANVDEGATEYAAGFDMIAVSGDCWLLQQAMQTAATELRQKCS